MVIGTAWDQAAFRFYEDGSEAGSTAIAAQNSNVTRDPNTDAYLLLRLRIQETLGSDGAATDDWRLQYSKNGGGYTDVNAVSSNNVRGFDSASLTDQGATTNRLTGGSGSFVAGLVSEDALADNLQITGNNFTEFLFPLQLAVSDLAHADTLDFRLLINGAVLDTYTVTPRITISIASGGGSSDLLLLGVG